MMPRHVLCFLTVFLLALAAADAPAAPVNLRGTLVP